MGLECQGVDGSRVDGLDGGQLLLVLVHEICQPEEQGTAVAGAHLSPLTVVESVLGCIDRLKYWFGL